MNRSTQDYRDLGARYARIAFNSQGTPHAMDYIRWMEFHKEYLSKQDKDAPDAFDQGFISELFTLRRTK